MPKPSKKQRIEALENIRNQINKIETLKQRRKTAAEMLSERLESNSAYEPYQLAKIALQEAKDKLFGNLAQDEEYIRLKDEFDNIKYEQGIEQEVLAAEVLTYREEFEAKAVETTEATERPIILKASLGKEQDIQLEMDFTGPGQKQEALDV